jgi:hypothetical protein
MSGPGLSDPAVRAGFLRATLLHVSFQITEALVWLPNANQDALRARAILTGARDDAARALARLDAADGTATRET